MVFLEEMAANPVETLSSVLAFVGMDLVDGDSEGGTKVKQAKAMAKGETHRV